MGIPHGPGRVLSSIVRSAATVAAYALSIAALAGCTTPFRTVHESFQVDHGGADTVHISVDVTVAELRLAGGTPHLLEGDFTYNTHHAEPWHRYAVVDGRGELEIRPVRSAGFPLGEADNRWVLPLADRTPTTLDIDVGVGELRLDLREVQLLEATIEVGVGEVDIDLGHPWLEDTIVDVECSVGELTIRVPDDVGVAVQAEASIGEVNARGFEKEGSLYVNELHGQTKVTIRIHARIGIGELRIVTRKSDGVYRM